MGAQVAALVLLGVAYAIADPSFRFVEWASTNFDGLALSVATFAAALLCLPLLRFLAGRREPAPWTFLGVTRRPLRDVLLGGAAMAVLIAAGDTLSFLLGRPIVPPFMADAWLTARSPALLCLAVVVVAPVLEELTFRGFLFGGLRACGAPMAVTVLVVSVLFTAIHAQYDLYDRTAVFVMSLLFIAARVRFDSVLPSIAMHAFANGVATIETIVLTAR